MKRVAFLFTQAPHGTASGREGLDAVLATGALSEDIGLFFVGDGVYQLLAAQKPQEILARDYIATFGVLPLYDIENIYLCESSAKVRGLADYTDWVLPVQILKQTDIQQQLAEYDTVMTF